jgi:hypothetical protein
MCREYDLKYRHDAPYIHTNIEYGDIENGEIEKNGDIEKKSGELNFKMPQYRFVENYKKCLITGFLGTKKNTSIPVV